MSIVTQTSDVNISSISEKSQNIKITNLSVTTGETSHALTANLRQLIIKDRGSTKLQVAFVATETATKYITIWKGTTLTLDELDLSGKTLYLKASASTIVEIIELY